MVGEGGVLMGLFLSCCGQIEMAFKLVEVLEIVGFCYLIIDEFAQDCMLSFLVVLPFISRGVLARFGLWQL